MATVELRRLEKTFEGGARVVEPLDLTVEDGELLVLVGPSGCGKSTILRMIAGLEQPSGGEVLLGGEPVTHRPPQERNVALVFQNYALYPHKTVRGNLAFPLRMMGLDRQEIEDRVGRTARLLGLGDLLDRRPAALSGGQRQRVAMGRAIVRDPRAFLMDEPLSNLDAKLRTRIRGEIARLQQRLAVTTIYVTHDQVEAMTLGDRIAVLFAGRLLQVGTASELYETPGDAWVASFLGSPPLALLRAHMERREGELRAVLGDQHLVVGSDRVPRAVREAERTDVLLGLRPEAFALAAAERSGRTLRLVARKAEHLGHETLLYLEPPCPTAAPREDGRTIHVEADPAKAELAARLRAGTPCEPGRPVSLTVDPGGILLFGPDGRGLDGR